MTLPSLNLSFEKHVSTATSLASTNKNEAKNDNSARNSIVLNIVNPLSPAPYPVESDSPPEERSPSAPPALLRKNTSSMKKPIAKRAFEKDNISLKSTNSDKPPLYKSPAFNDIEKEFKDQLLFFTTEILLKDIDLVKNIADTGNKVLFHVEQLKQLIAILYLNEDDRRKYDELIEIETENVVSKNCFCKECKNPFYLHIKNIYVNNSVNFLTTPFAVNMTSTFKISLERCLTG
jgi:hypothetical protein